MIGRSDIAPLLAAVVLAAGSILAGASTPVGSDVGAPVPTSSVTPTPSTTPSPTPTPTPSASEEAAPTEVVPAPDAAAPAPAAPPAPAPAAPPPPPAPPAPPVCSSDVLTCVNAIRAYNGLGGLASNGTLNAAAQACAERMAAAGSMTHSSATPGFGAWAENIAQGYGSGAAVFNGWMGSTGHRNNILGSYTQMGLGYVASGNWWCQQFGA